MYNLLVVDDEKLIREGMARAVGAHGAFSVHTAANGIEALKILESMPIDAMLLDISMPDMNGLDLLRALTKRNIRPLTIIISGYEQFDYAREAMQYGAVDYALKPVDADDLSAMCAKLLQMIENRRAQKQQLAQLQSHVLTHLKEIKQKLLTDILDGHVKSEQLEDMRALYGIDLRGNEFCAAVILLRRVSSDVGEVDFQVALKQFEAGLERSIARARPFCVNLFNMENARYILLISGTSPLPSDAIDALLDEALRLAEDVPALKAYVGKSGHVSPFDRLSTAYAQANDALDYRAIFGHGVVYDIRDYQKNPYLTAASQFLDALEGSLRLMQFDKAEAQIQSLYDYLFKNLRAITPAQARYFAMRCQLILAACLIRNGMDVSDEVFSESVRLRGNALNEKSLDRFRTRALQILRAITRSFKEDYRSQHEKIAAEVRMYIDENYHDNRLSVNRLSPMFGYSANYLGNIFKKVYSLSVNDYINQCRINQAKRLMDETALRVYEIAFRVGFSDQHYFSKTFKKYAGFSPTEYRDRNGVCPP